MKVARLCHLVLPLLLAGCANPRTFSGSSSMGGGGPTYAPTPATGGGGGTTLGDPEDGFSQRSNRPITPKVTTPTRPSRPAPNTTPTPAPKGPTLGLPTARRNDTPTASIGAPVLGGDSPEAGNAVRNTIGVPLVWNRRYQSTQRRPIETLVFGTGDRRVMVIGSLHGDEPQSVGLVDELALHLRANPDVLAGLRVLLVRSPNPDGLAGRTSVNSHGIDLNRNFPAPNWARTADKHSGTKAGSELETQVMVRLTSEFRPNLVVHLKDSRDKGRINSEGACRELADAFASQMKFEVLRDGGAKTSGSYENYAVGKLNCPVLTILIPLEKDDPTAWQKNGPALLKILQPSAEPSVSWRKIESRQVAERPDSPDSETPRTRVRTLDLRQDDPTRVVRPDGKPKSASLSIPDRGYYELPGPVDE